MTFRARRGLMLEDTFDRRLHESRPKPPGAPLTPIFDVYPKNGVWSGNNNLGVQRAFSPDANNRQSILIMPEWGFPKVWTISLGISPLAIRDVNTFNGRNITAYIEFGVGGITQVIEVDWVNGAQVSVVANAINVIAQYANIDVGSEGDFKLSVQCAHYPRATSLPPRRTLTVSPFSTIPPPAPQPGESTEFIVLAAGGGTSGLLAIPPFATKIYAYPALADVAAIKQFYSDTTILSFESGTGAGTISTIAVSGTDLLELGGGIPVTGSSLFARLDNLDPTPGHTVWATLYAELSA